MTKVDLFYLTNLLFCSFNKSQIQFLRPQEIKKHVCIWLIKTVKTGKPLYISAMCWLRAVHVWTLHIHISFLILESNRAISCLLSLLSSSYQSQIASDSECTLAYHTKGPCCSGSNQIQGCKVSKKFIKLKVKQIPLPYCLHTFTVKDNPQPARFSKNTHTFSDCMFSLFSYHSWGSSEAWPDWRGRHTILPFLNCQTVCKLVKLFIKTSSIWYITNKHRYHPVFQKRKQQICYLQGAPSPTVQAWQSELRHRTVLVSQLGAMLRDLAHAAFHAALPFCPADHVPSNTRGKHVRSYQDHSKVLQRLQSNPFL